MLNIKYQSGGYLKINIEYQSGGYLIFNIEYQEYQSDRAVGRNPLNGIHMTP